MYKSLLMFLAFIPGTVFMFDGLKDGPQVFLLVLGALTLITFLVKARDYAVILFYLLFGIMCYINYFLLTYWIINTLNPDAGWVTFEGERYRVMTMDWVWAILAGLVLASVTMYAYSR